MTCSSHLHKRWQILNNTDQDFKLQLNLLLKCLWDVLRGFKKGIYRRAAGDQSTSLSMQDFPQIWPMKIFPQNTFQEMPFSENTTLYSKQRERSHMRGNIAGWMIPRMQVRQGGCPTIRRPHLFLFCLCSCWGTKFPALGKEANTCPFQSSLTERLLFWCNLTEPTQIEHLEVCGHRLGAQVVARGLERL